MLPVFCHHSDFEQRKQLVVNKWFIPNLLQNFGRDETHSRRKVTGNFEVPDKYSLLSKARTTPCHRLGRRSEWVEKRPVTRIGWAARAIRNSIQIGRGLGR